jgi:tRNA-binding EMAP/Myf-like protein
VLLVDDFVVLVVVEVSPKEESLKLLVEDLDLWD